MDNLDKELHRLSKIKPNKAFVKNARARLMHQIRLEANQSWFQAVLKKLGVVMPSAKFVAAARTRLMAQIKTAPKRSALVLATVFKFMKRAVASTLVMSVSVFSVLLFTADQNGFVLASDDSYLIVEGDHVSVTHQNGVASESVTGQVEIESGILIDVGPDSRALIHFFDGSEIRLDENSEFFLEELASNPNFPQQSIISGSLNRGNMWVQTFNIDLNDGHSSMTIASEDILVNAFNASFSLSTHDSSVAVFDGRLQVSSVDSFTQERLETIKLIADQVAVVEEERVGPVITEQNVNEALLASDWVQSNKLKDDANLSSEREESIEILTELAGSGSDFFDGLNRDVTLFFSGHDSEKAVQVANSHLIDALVSSDQGDVEAAKISLLEYQKVVGAILNDGEIDQELATELTNELIMPALRVVAMQEPDHPATGDVRKVLQETAEEIVESDPVKVAAVEADFALLKLDDIAELVGENRLEEAAEKLNDYEKPQSEIVQIASSTEAEAKTLASVIDKQDDELALLSAVTRDLVAINGDHEMTNELIAMVEGVSEEAEKNVEKTRLATSGLADPSVDVLDEKILVDVTEVEDDLTEEEVPLIATEKSLIDQIVAQINAYNTWEEQKAQIVALLNLEDASSDNIAFLKSVQTLLFGRANEYLATVIYQLEKKSQLAKVPQIASALPPVVVEEESAPNNLVLLDDEEILLDPVDNLAVEVADPIEEEVMVAVDDAIVADVMVDEPVVDAATTVVESVDMNEPADSTEAGSRIQPETGRNTENNLVPLTRTSAVDVSGRMVQ